MHDHLQTAVAAATRAGDFLKSHAGSVLVVHQATKHDIKLDLDVRAQEMIFADIQSAFPEHALFGEEGIGGNAASDHQWVVDPLDGTVNFFYGIPHWCVSIALRRAGQIVTGVIYDPNTHELWSYDESDPVPHLNGIPIRAAQRKTLGDAVVIVGLSRTSEAKAAAMPVMLRMIDEARKCRFMGSAALAMAYVACGRIDAYMEPGISLWDIAAGIPLVESAGGVVRLTARDGHERYSIVAQSGAVECITHARWVGPSLELGAPA